MIFFKALLAGLAISAPMGPINMVCIKTTVKQGLSGFFIVAAASGLANIILSGCAASGSLVLISYLNEYKQWLHALGGCVLIGFGIQELVKSKREYVDNDSQSLASLFLQVISIGLSNPMTILGYMSLMMELAGSFQRPGLVISVVLGLTTASVAWRLCLGTFVMRMQKKFVIDYVRYLNILCPLCFFYFGVSSLARAISF